MPDLTSQIMHPSFYRIFDDDPCDQTFTAFHYYYILGSYTDFVPRHAKQYAKLADIIRDAITEYDKEVKAGTFPTAKQSFSMDESLLADLKAE